MKRILLAAVAALSIAAPASAATVVTAERMLDVDSGRYVDHPAILIGDDGRIQPIDESGSMQLPAGTKHIDLSGETLLPGLIDMHVHLTSRRRPSAAISGLEYTDNFWTVVGVANAKKTLEAGFTTVRNVGSRNYDDVGLKQAIEDGYIPGPRIVPATYAIGATGGHCDRRPSFRLHYDQPATGSTTAPTNARQLVRSCTSTAPR